MFANILFSGPCNARCPFCIGNILDSKLNQNNLNLFPLHNMEEFFDKLIEKKITEISISWTNTDPLLYQHHEKLIWYIREKIPEAKISLHTNGRLLVKKKDIAILYDRIALSLASFEESTYKLMMWVSGIPDIKHIVENIDRPLKISCIVTQDNLSEIKSFVRKCKTLDIKRLVFRKLYQDKQGRKTYINPDILWWKLISNFANNPVYDFNWMEITLWNFT